MLDLLAMRAAVYLYRSTASGLFPRRLPRSSQHERDRRACSSLRFASNLETVTPIEGDSARVGGLEVGGHVGGVDNLQAGPHHLAPEPSALQGGVDSEPRQLPIRVGRMGCIHLAEDVKHVVMLVRCDGPRQARW